MRKRLIGKRINGWKKPQSESEKRPPWESDERSWKADSDWHERADSNWQANKDEKMQQDDQVKTVIRKAVTAAVAIQVMGHVANFNKRWCARETQWFEELRYERAAMEQEKDMLKMFLDRHQEIDEEVKRLRNTLIEKATRVSLMA